MLNIGRRLGSGCCWCLHSICAILGCVSGRGQDNNIILILFQYNGLVTVYSMFQKVNIPNIFFLALPTNKSPVKVYSVNMSFKTRFVFISVISFTTFISKRLHFFLL